MDTDRIVNQLVARIGEAEKRIAELEATVRGHSLLWAKEVTKDAPAAPAATASSFEHT